MLAVSFSLKCSNRLQVLLCEKKRVGSLQRHFSEELKMNQLKQNHFIRTRFRAHFSFILTKQMDFGLLKFGLLSTLYMPVIKWRERERVRGRKVCLLFWLICIDDTRGTARTVSLCETMLTLFRVAFEFARKPPLVSANGVLLACVIQSNKKSPTKQR